MNFSNAMKQKYARVLLLGLLTTPFLGAAAADENAATPFTMAVLTDEAFGKMVQSGRYEQAIEKLTRRGARASNGFARQNNLCVAYAKAADLTNAVAACEAAIAKVMERESQANNRPKRSHAARAYRSDLAIVLSNQGVLLAVQGATDEAKATFEAAIELGARASRLAAKNLDRLIQMNGSEA